MLEKPLPGEINGDSATSERFAPGDALAPIPPFLSGAPDYHAATRKMFEEASVVSDEAERQQALGEVHRRVHGFAVTAAPAGLAITARVASALATLLKKLSENPKTITSSTMSTVSKAFAFLERLCLPGLEKQLAQQPPVRMLVVEDEPLAKRAVMGTLERAFDKPESASNGSTALALVSQKTYDVIFTDVQMPVMDGFDLCTLIRSSDTNGSTPVVFISGLNDAASHSRGYECGGNDFIKKPFLPIEMTLKALTFAWEGRLRQITSDAV